MVKLNIWLYNEVWNNNYRRRYGITGIQEGLPQPLENPFKDLTNEQLLEGFGTL